MIDHVLGRPSARSRLLQVVAVLSFWLTYIKRGHRHGPPILRQISRFLTSRVTPWQILTLTITYLYAARNLTTLTGLSSPDPLANMYEASYFRATWVLTAMDAGFWTAMGIRNRRLRDLASVVFTVFYLFAADAADEKVRKVRGNLTIDHIRVSWNKPMTPYLRGLHRLIGPKFLAHSPRQIRIARPEGSDYTEPVTAWLYFDGSLSEMQDKTKVLIDIPGGGFVAMGPRCNDDKLGSWAAKTGLPVLALDYKKAPEHPYPYALNECFDVYIQILRTKGRCMGLSGEQTPSIVLSGDSSGGNLAAGTTLMLLERTVGTLATEKSKKEIVLPECIVMFYPSLDMNIGSWMSDEDVALIGDSRERQTNRRIVKRKKMQYDSLMGTPMHSESEDSDVETKVTSPKNQRVARPKQPKKPQNSAPEPPKPLSTRLVMSSKISYFSDRVLTPEMMRAMVIMYVGPHNRPDFRSDYLLSPILAPDSLLQHFPKTYMMTGERDPLVDDTVIFAGRLRQAKRFLFQESEGLGPQFTPKDVVEVDLIQGVSHAFLQIPVLYPRAWGLIGQAGDWITEGFNRSLWRRRREVARKDWIHRQVTASHLDREDIHDSSADEAGIELDLTRKKASSKSPSVTPGSRISGSATVAVSREPSSIEVVPKSAMTVLGDFTERIGGFVRGTGVERVSSQEDLLKRRMDGLAGGLAGKGLGG